jgi:hypothetical protein
MYFVQSPEGGPVAPSAELRSLLGQADIYFIDQLWGATSATAALLVRSVREELFVCGDRDRAV